MRPRIIEYLTNTFHFNSISYLIPTGAIVYVFAILMIAWIFMRRCQVAGLSTYHARRAIVLAIVGAIFGAHVFYLVQHLKYVIDHPNLILNVTRGTASWGAYLGGIFCFSLYLRKQRLSIISYADVLASSLALGPLIGRWSCFLNGCCYGTLSNLPWAVAFPKYSMPYREHVRLGLIHPDAELSLSVHPVQIYSSLAALIIFFLMSKVWIDHRDKPGITFAAYWLIYCAIRFGIEFFRGDVDRYGSLSLSQIICIVIVMSASAGISAMLSIYKKR